MADTVDVTVRVPAWVVRRIERLPETFTGRVEMNFHQGKIGSVNVTERVTADK